MNPIRPLDPVLIDQIAAGEVVERPASVVKELVENALDAGAERIEVRLEEGGIRRIEVRDDGCGIPADQLELAVRSHATSKLRTAEDLTQVATLGFRGEALASIAAVSRFEILSRAEGESAAARLEVRFGCPGPVREASGPRGTRVRVEDLFAELPARRKFLRRPATELAHGAAWVERLALVHRGVGFRLEHGDRVLLEVPPDAGREERWARILGRGLAERLVEIRDRRPGLVLEARVGPPESARRNASRVHLFLNGRWVRDPRLLRAVREGVREFVPAGMLPALVLELAVPPERIDVNVHPQKTEVRFRDERLVIGAVITALRRGLSGSEWSARGVGSIGRVEEAAPTATRRPAPATGSAGAPWERPLPAAVGPPAGPTADHPAPSQPELPLPPPAGGPGAFLSVARTFLLREVPGGLEILDQHALHERINLEELRREIRSGAVVAQPLLVPAVVEVDRVELDLLLARAEDFRRLGVELEALGPGSIAVRSVPARLTRLDPEGLVRDLLEIAGEQREAGPEALQEEVLHRMACRGAVMAGDHLDAEALADLLRRGADLPQDRTCAHGRPVRVFLSVADLERAFHRR
ncbi:MAG: DNA mismatch repair endonuclease MutL [Planctomycetota bacterium]|nr:MAG: DNA mismatch repair endonuclease MutL [Planctomycetota bacterium]